MRARITAAVGLFAACSVVEVPSATSGAASGATSGEWPTPGPECGDDPPPVWAPCSTPTFVEACAGANTICCCEGEACEPSYPDQTCSSCQINGSDCAAPNAVWCCL